MNNNPLISIIIPVYNNHKQLPYALKSIYSQTYSNLEVIFVDNNSTDHSYDFLCNSVIETKHIKIIDANEIQGPSYAQNKGIEVANGDFICFMDADDYILPEYVQRMYEIMSEVEDDYKDKTIITVGFNCVDNFDYNSKDQDTNIVYKEYLGYSEIIYNLMVTHEIHLPSWGKLYPSTLLSSNTFDNRYFLQDYSSCHKILLTCDRVIVSDEKLYLHLQRVDSISRTLNNRFYSEYFLITIEQIHFLQSLVIEKDTLRVVYSKRVMSLVNSICTDPLIHLFSYLEEDSSNFIKTGIINIRYELLDNYTNFVRYLFKIYLTSKTSFISRFILIKLRIFYKIAKKFRSIFL